MDIDEKINIIRNWTYRFTHYERHAGHIVGRIKVSPRSVMINDTSIHVYFDDMVNESYNIMYNFVSRYCGVS